MITMMLDDISIVTSQSHDIVNSRSWSLTKHLVSGHGLRSCLLYLPVLSDKVLICIVVNPSNMAQCGDFG